jgi:hypothetical protein
MTDFHSDDSAAVLACVYLKLAAKPELSFDEAFDEVQKDLRIIEKKTEATYEVVKL